MELSYASGCLLDAFAGLLELQYLSDLRLPHQRRELARRLPALQPDAFSLAQWNEAVFYLLGRQQSFSSPQAAFDFLLDALSVQPPRG